ncbi:hypothetical protein NW766_010737 [Fusarium irregulare]|uniref:Uncharacterized protein n=1 Tax=Fusarium irregulare TaxID=2494466 RepID=A0A9W8PG56_9HYPO|nr:hypothetical protein NW766_010737 [Fusarium irregulare]
MHFSTSILLFTSTVVGLGINCRGSGFCDLTFGSSIGDIQDQIGILVADGQGNRHFDTGAVPLDQQETRLVTSSRSSTMGVHFAAVFRHRKETMWTMGN